MWNPCKASDMDSGGVANMVFKFMVCVLELCHQLLLRKFLNSRSGITVTFSQVPPIVPLSIVRQQRLSDKADVLLN